MRVPDFSFVLHLLVAIVILVEVLITLSTSTQQLTGCNTSPTKDVRSKSTNRSNW
ncbi:hypothetical protein Plhal703r1_c03g0016601 [Plasmopara halstedii]